MHRAIFIFFSLVFIISCKDDEPLMCPEDPVVSSIPIGEDYDLNLPDHFAEPTTIPADNPMKKESVNLGRFLFWEKKLSGDNSMSCGSCHAPEHAFSTNNVLDIGIDGVAGNRNTMPLVNMIYQSTITWDGGAESLEEQALEPVENPIEMHDNWANAVQEIADDPDYDALFTAAYGTSDVDSIRITKSISQFIRSLISQDSKYDKWKKGDILFLSNLEFEGLNLFSTEGGSEGDGADCFHCHEPFSHQFRKEGFSNNGLDSIFTDLGRGEITGLPSDYGKFKIPTLRNVEYSAPFMHDGRFETLDDVIDHYNAGGLPSPTIDPFMEAQGIGLTLTNQEKAALKAFLLTLSDADFINNPDFSDPH